jgi:hypothetical protein
MYWGILRAKSCIVSTKFLFWRTVPSLLIQHIHSVSFISGGPLLLCNLRARYFLVTRTQVHSIMTKFSNSLWIFHCCGQ